MSDPTTVEVGYRRQGDLVRVRLANLTNRELRAVLVGLWLRLDAEDRADHIRELEHYSDPGTRPSPISLTIADPHPLVDVERMLRAEHGG